MIYKSEFHTFADQIMTFLLTFFLDKKCLSTTELIHWYRSEDVFGYIGFSQAKRLAEPFIRSIDHDGEIA